MRSDTTWTTAQIRTIKNVTASIRLIEFAPAQGRPSWTPGSHIEVGVLAGGRSDTRHYSLVGEPDGHCFRIAVKREDPSRGGSAYMWTLTPGSSLNISAPKNLFDLQLGRPDYVLMAGGIGITPIVGMAQALVKRGTTPRLLYSARSRAEMAFVPELSALLGDKLELYPSDEGHRLDIAGEVGRLPAKTELYLCGPLRMLDAARAAWKTAGRSPAGLRYETFANSGRHAPEPFWVRIPSQSMEILVPENKTMLDALTEAGIEVMWDCRRGECGLCAVDIVTMAGEIDHRDVFLSEHQKHDNTRICTCVSRAVGGGVEIDTGYRPG